MIIRFSKYHGTGNDFIMIDNRSSVLRNSASTTELIAHLCHRRFGIGADGLILINSSNKADFEMIYFNSDGREGSMCGNGGRCAVSFANSLGIIKDKTIFTAIDGMHEAEILKKEKDNTEISLRMQDIKGIENHDNFFILNTGSPHYVCFRNKVSEMDVYNEGRNIRYSKAFAEKGINVNFAEVIDDAVYVRTYERGVEDETLSCGTGSTATALAASLSGFCNTNSFCKIKTLGGNLTVKFQKISETEFHNVWLEGPAVCAFKGEVII
jgi:diaminopimelate epimerase